jgi:hypothetical protein
LGVVHERHDDSATASRFAELVFGKRSHQGLEIVPIAEIVIRIRDVVVKTSGEVCKKV